VPSRSAHRVRVAWRWSRSTLPAPFNGDLIVYALPGVAGAWLGLQVFQKLSDLQFQRLVNLALIVSGIALALK